MEEHIKILKALSDSTRFKIVLYLLESSRNVAEITQHIKKSQPTTSLQLRFLELSGLISSEKAGRQVFYKLSSNKVRRVIKALRT